MPDAMVAARESKAASGTAQQVDVAVVGAGFAGLYLLHRLRKAGLTAVALEEAGDVGGTWYWNRYPGARCDIQTIDYTLHFRSGAREGVDLVGEVRGPARDPALSRLRRRPLRSAPRHPLQDQGHGSQMGRSGRALAARHRQRRRPSPAATTSWPPAACPPKPPEIEGVKDFEGKVYFTGRWPHDGVDLAGKRVAVIGTGSSAIQSIPLIAEQAAQLTVFQRTPNFALPAHNGPSPADRMDILLSDRAAYREQARQSNDRRALSAADGRELAVERCRAPRTLRDGLGGRRSRLTS